MKQINLTKVKADAEERLSDDPYRPRMMSSAERIPRAPTMDIPEKQALENVLVLIDALERAVFALNELCNCGKKATWCYPCEVLGFVSEVINFEEVKE